MAKATIVGAGLVGSLWAVLLRQRGVDVEVYEKRPDPRKEDAAGGRSINLVITSRGLLGLEKAGLLHRVNDLAVPVYGRMIHSKAGEQVYQAYGQHNECNLSISRAALNRFLLDEAARAGARIYFQHELEGIDPHARELSFKTHAGARRISYELLFGTDGAGSRARKALVKALPRDFSESVEWLDADYKELTMPAGADGRPALRPDALHIWPRGAHMLMALANRDGGFTMTMYLPKAGRVPSFETVGTRADVVKLFENDFADAIPLMPGYADEFMAHPEGGLGTVRAPKWVYKDSIALMGDAAHAIVPFFGQGMNAGFEDCTVLLDAWERAKWDWGRALSEYERIQKPNADAIADMALENWIEMRDRVGDAAFLARKKVEGALERKFPGRFKSRYGLITYTLTPYAVAKRAGVVQDRMFAKLLEGHADPERVDWSAAERLLEDEWSAFVRNENVLMERYPPVEKN